MNQKDLDYQNELTYGKPDESVVQLKDEPHKHFFIRKSASEFGCRDCYNGWIDGGRFILDNGEYKGVKV